MRLKEEVKHYTLAEYLALEEQASHKSEFYRGEIRPNKACTPQRSAMAANCIRALGNACDEEKWQVFDSNLRVHIRHMDTVLYPEVAICCEGLEIDPELPSLVPNPNLILEISAQNLGDKFFKYQMIPTLQTYVLVEQQEPCVHVSSKSADGNWSIRSYVGLDAFVELAPLGVSIRMADIYKWVKF